MRKLILKSKELEYLFTAEKGVGITTYKMYEDEELLISAIEDGDGFNFGNIVDYSIYYGFAELLLFMNCVKICDPKLMSKYEVLEHLKIDEI